MLTKTFSLGCSAFLLLGLSVGCAVPQPRGAGLYSHVQEPTTKAYYHLYLPVDYVKNQGRHPNPRMQKWPLVMTFHGMKPYDNALFQEREWETEADTYGFIVCSPALSTSDSFMEYPLTKEHSYVLEDKKNVIAIMDHVFATTNADSKKVLATSWSCGGYLAHYFVNRYPDRFSCLAVRLSNFSASLLTEATVPVYRDKVPVAMFIGDGDFPACKTESEEAVAWYTARNFRVVRGKMIDNMGHRRIPQTCAAFFAEQVGIEPIYPAKAAETVAQVQMTEYQPPPTMVARFLPSSRVGSPPISTVAMNEPARRSTAPVTPPASPSNYSKPASSGNSPPTAANYVSSSGARVYPPSDSGETMLAEMTPTNSGRSQAPPSAAKSSTVRTADAGRSSSPPPPKPASSRTNPDNKGTSSGARVAMADSTKPKSSYGSGMRPNEAPARPESATAKNRTPRNNSSSTGSKPASAGNALATAASPPKPVRRGRASPVNIRLRGPNIGTAPYYLEYSLDLPRENLEGADFLWMDNGVWMGDEQSGVKILETPGTHRISVLVVTRDDREFRGQASVQVLERGPTAFAR